LGREGLIRAHRESNLGRSGETLREDNGLKERQKKQKEVSKDRYQPKTNHGGASELRRGARVTRIREG